MPIFRHARRDHRDLNMREIGREAKSFFPFLGLEHSLTRRPSRIQLKVRNEEERNVFLSTIHVKVP